MKETAEEEPISISNEVVSVKLRHELVLTRGALINCTCVFVTDPTNFCLQLVGEEEKLEALMDSMAKAYQDSTIEEFFKPNQGDCCVAFYAEDQRWYRAEVLEVKPNCQFFICYVDYGNCESVGLEKLRRMKAEWTREPSFGHLCGLPLLPINGPDWTEDVIRRVDEALGNAESLQAELIELGDGPTALVNLILNGSDYSTSLIREGLARSMMTQVTEGSEKIDYNIG